MKKRIPKAKVFFIIIFSIALFGCNGTIEDKIVDNIKNNCRQYPCLVRMNKLTDFSWDKVYVFGDAVSDAQIEQTVSTKVPDKKNEFARTIVFTKEDKVVYYEELPTDIEGMVKNQLTFDNVEPTTYKSYAVENAAFEIVQSIHGGIPTYHFEQKGQ